MRPRLLPSAERKQCHAQLPQAVGLAVGVIELSADGQAPALPEQCLAVAALPPVKDAKVIEAGRLARAVTQLPR